VIAVLIVILCRGDKRPQVADIKRAIKIAADWKECTMAMKKRVKENFLRYDTPVNLKVIENFKLRR
jgi:hypothetical protein